MQTYIVIDSSQQPHYYQKLGRYSANFRSLFEGFAEESLPEIAPLLIEMPHSREALRARLDADIKHLSETRPCICRLESRWDIDALAQHLRQFHIVELPEGRRMIMRWYDTRILPVWWDVLTAGQRKTFMHGVESWHYYDRYGDEATLSHPEQEDVTVVSPFSLSERQYEQLLHAAEPDVLIAHLRTVVRDEIRKLSPRTLYPFVALHLDAARQHGLEDFDDQIQYLLMALYTSGRFVEHPATKERLDTTAATHEQSFSDWAAGLPDSLWETGLPLWQVEQHAESVAGAAKP